MGNLTDWLIRRNWTPRMARYGAYAIIALVIGALVWAVVAIPSCLNGSQRAAQGRLDAEQTSAASNSGADAVATVERSGRDAAASESLTRSNEENIRAAEGAGERVNPGVDSAGRRALCLRDAYKDMPICKKP